MQLVEQHCIRKSDPRSGCIDQAAFASKNLYNQATYQIRQAFFQDGTFPPYAALYHRVKHLQCYQALPRNVSNSILIQIEQNWKAFRKGLQAWREHPERFTGRPRIPGYKHKETGRNLLIYDKQALGKRAFTKTGKLVPSGLPIQIDTAVSWEALDQVRIVPRIDGYVIEVVYQQAVTPAQVDPTLMAALDLGVDTLAAARVPSPGSSPCSSRVAPSKASISCITSGVPISNATSPTPTASPRANSIRSRRSATAACKPTSTRQAVGSSITWSRKALAPW